MLDILVSILVISLVKRRAFETFNSTISSNNIKEFDGAAVADYLGLHELWNYCFGRNYYFIKKFPYIWTLIHYCIIEVNRRKLNITKGTSHLWIPKWLSSTFRGPVVWKIQATWLLYSAIFQINPLIHLWYNIGMVKSTWP